MREKGAYVRYVGREVREVPGAGVFQHGTVAFVPRVLALRLLEEDDFEAAGDPAPATRIVFRIGPATPADVRNAQTRTGGGEAP